MRLNCRAGGKASELAKLKADNVLVSRTKLRSDGDAPKVQQHETGGGESRRVAPKVKSERSKRKELRNDRDGSGHALLEANSVAPGRARRRGKGDASGWRRSRAKSEELHRAAP